MLALLGIGSFSEHIAFLVIKLFKYILSIILNEIWCQGNFKPFFLH